MTHNSGTIVAASSGSAICSEAQKMTHQKPSFRRAVGFALAVTILLAQPAAGQNTPPPLNPPAPLITYPNAFLNQERLPPYDGTARQPGASNPTETLSEKLDRTEGVICPPVVDPEIADLFPNGEAVNAALRSLAEIAKRTGTMRLKS